MNLREVLTDTSRELTEKELDNCNVILEAYNKIVPQGLTPKQQKIFVDILAIGINNLQVLNKKTNEPINYINCAIMVTAVSLEFALIFDKVLN